MSHKNNITEISQSLELLFQAENKVVELIKNTGLRCSPNKLTADLGEFYAYRALFDSGLFKSLSSQTISNADYDLFGHLAPDSALSSHFELGKLRIEVKTRRNQKGVKYLGGVQPEKFDLLCVVDIANNYSLNKVHLVKSEVAELHLDRKRQRLIFKEGMSFLTLI